jgi:hypothetical protein
MNDGGPQEENMTVALTKSTLRPVNIIGIRQVIFFMRTTGWWGVSHGDHARWGEPQHPA